MRPTTRCASLAMERGRKLADVAQDVIEMAKLLL
jgi:AmiR/NasT family two-component response regulator